MDATSPSIRAFKTRKQIALLSLDISNAFDRAPHPIILQALLNAQTPSYLAAIIQSFLSNRRYTIQSSSDSLTVTTTSGTPQGSVLSPFLFTLLMNSLPSFLPPDVQPIIYADDILLIIPISPNTNRPTLLQDTANAIEDWTRSVHLPLNPQKCQLLRLSRLLKALAVV